MGNILNSRPPIPEPIKRKVRQNCGFGCVLCGSPIYDYEHIEEYAKVKEHSLENITLLCPTCHRKKTRGIIAKDKIITATKDSIKRDRTSSDDIPLESYILDIGGNYIQTFSGVVFDIFGFGYFFIKFREHPLINAAIWDKNKEAAIQITNNVYTLSSKTWDIESEGNTLTFRNEPRKIFCRFTIDGEKKIISIRGSIKLSNGVAIKIKDEGIYANNIKLAFLNIIHNSGEGIIITNKNINKPEYFITGIVKNNTFRNFKKIAAFNCIDCFGNKIDSCQTAFLWHINFLKYISENPNAGHPNGTVMNGLEIVVRD